MKNQSIYFCALILILVLFQSCNPPTSQKPKDIIISTQVPSETVKESPKPAVPSIEETAFEGISPGDKIAEHQGNLEQAIQKNGEGTFDIYNIKNATYGVMGYLYPDPKTPTLVGDVVINSPLAKTKDGIHVGKTFGALMQKYPNIEVRGSEIEGRTYAKQNNLSFRLDFPHFKYELDKKTIPPTTKIIEIVIGR